MLPLSLLTTAKGQPMLIELKNGDTYNGRLVSADTWMNVNLEEVICTSRDGDRFWKLKECYIRGNSIKYLRIPDEIIDLAQEEEISAKDAKKGGKGGRGRVNTVGMSAKPRGPPKLPSDSSPSDQAPDDRPSDSPSAQSPDADGAAVDGGRSAGCRAVSHADTVAWISSWVFSRSPAIFSGFASKKLAPAWRAWDPADVSAEMAQMRCGVVDGVARSHWRMDAVDATPSMTGMSRSMTTMS
ncbi:U6 snRNA binding protein [Aureococcus anophagefferens]|nr:U6 snRNA binding protein [Aureococcus anophagefferens]